MNAALEEKKREDYFARQRIENQRQGIDKDQRKGRTRKENQRNGKGTKITRCVEEE